MSRLSDLSGWRLEAHRGAAAELHDLAWPDPLRPTVWVLSAETPAVVAGTGRGRVALDADLAARLGVQVAVRSSGGGAVLVDPRSSSWVDVLVPRGHRAWDDDVSRSMVWVGERWSAALGRLGVDAEVHRGAMACGRWGRQVCFAGVAAGEVVVDGAKAVGISQRRTRAGARFQCTWYRHHDAELLAALVAPGVEDPEALVVALREGVATIPVDPDLLVGALVAELDRA